VALLGVTTAPETRGDLTMTTPWSTAFRRTAKTRSSDSMHTRDGKTLAVHDAEAEDPIAYLATIFDRLPGSPRD